MRTLELTGVSIDGVCAALPQASEDNLARCTELYGDAAKAASVVKATGILRRRIAAAGTTSLDLCVAAAEVLMKEAAVSAADVGGVVFVTFTPADAMPCNACQAQARLGLGNDIVAFDVGLACSGYAYGLYLAGSLARATGRKILLLDGDAQTAHVKKDDGSTVPVLADAGTATIVSPSGTDTWEFAFLSKGEDGAALRLPVGGTISMDGFAVYRFVAMDVQTFIKGFLAETGRAADSFDAFVPHQANVFMIRQLAKSLGFAADKLLVSADEVGNSASATVPVTIARCAKGGQRLLVSGFGGGLSASVASITLSKTAVLMTLNV